VTRRLQLLVGGSLGLWLAVSYPAWRLGGLEMLAYSAAALLLCLLPTVATLLLAIKAERQSPQNVLLMLLGGTGIRMFVVLGVGLLVCLTLEVNVVAYWLWMLVFYLATLALEVTLLVLPGTR